MPLVLVAEETVVNVEEHLLGIRVIVSSTKHGLSDLLTEGDSLEQDGEHRDTKGVDVSTF